MPILTTIIPLYNGEKYILKCLESVTNQGVDISEHEILVVNDGSKDNGPLLVQEYSHTHSNIILINKENGGVSSARNLGLSRAQGEYIHFMDADDELVAGSYKYLLDEKKGFDIIRFSSVTVDKRIDAEEVIRKNNGNSQWKQYDNTLSYVESNRFPTFVWGGLYRRMTLNDLQFQPYTMSEDVLFNVQLFCSNEQLSIASTSKILYKYYLHEGSAMTLISNEHIKTVVQNMIGINSEMSKIEIEHPKYKNGFVKIKKASQRQTVTRLLSGAFSYNELKNLLNLCYENNLFPMYANNRSEKIMSLLVSYPWLLWFVSPLYRNVFLKFVKPFIKRN